MATKLLCLLENDNVSKVFKPKDITWSNSVDDLKNAITLEISDESYKPKARNLILWYVFILDDKKGSAIRLADVIVKMKLDDPTKSLVDLFPKGLDENTFILVQRPQQVILTRVVTTYILVPWNQYSCKTFECIYLVHAPVPIPVYIRASTDDPPPGSPPSGKCH